MTIERYKELLVRMNTILNDSIKEIDESVAVPGVALISDYAAAVKGEKKASAEASKTLVSGLEKIIEDAKDKAGKRKKSAFDEAYDLTLQVVDECKQSNDEKIMDDFRVTMSENVYPNLAMIIDTIKESENNCLGSDIFKGKVRKTVEEYISLLTQWRLDAEKYAESAKKLLGYRGEIEQIVVKVSDGILMFGQTLEVKVNKVLEKYESRGWTPISVAEVKGEDTLLTMIGNLYKSILNLGKDKHHRTAHVTFERRV